MSSTSDKSPSIFGVFFFAVLMALFGVLLGFVYMASFSAQAFSSQADYEASLKDIEEPIPEPRPGDGYYIEGEVSQTRSWEPKRDLLGAPGAQTVKFTEGEINAWMSAKFRPGAAISSEDASSILIVPGVPNVALLEAGTLYFNLPTTITAYGVKSDFTISAHCDLGADGFQFNSVNVSSAKVPLPNLLGAKILKVLAQGYQSTEEYTILFDAFARADSVDVEGRQLVFELR